jgi:hypothetical protein
MNNIAIIPQIFLYGLQNQNVERKIAKPIDINFLQKKPDCTNIDEIIVSQQDNNEEIPEILIQKEEPEPLPQNDILSETLIDKNNFSSVNI